MTTALSRPLGARDHFRYRTVDLVTTVVIGIAVGVAFFGWDRLYDVLSLGSIAFPPAAGLFGGPWLLGGALAAMIVRKPGAALVAELIAANVEYLLGNQWGASTLLSGALQGLGFEIALLLVLYRRSNIVVISLGAALAALLETVYEWQVYWTDWQWGYKLAYLAMFVVSAILVCAVIGTLLVRALAATGALNAFPPGREYHERHAV